MEEIWKDIEGYEGLFQVSNFGRVKNVKKRVIVPQHLTKGYLCVSLYANKKQKCHCVHKLVALAFLENDVGTKRVHHLDGDKTNNNVNNLCFEKPAFGVGINDIDKRSSSEDKNLLIANRIWKMMIRRCYDKNIKYKSYKNCSVCDEWLKFSGFLKWFKEHKDEYKEGYQLDKDILSKDSKIYSPSTCCFVPQKINKAVVTMSNKKDGLPPGVCRLKGRKTFAGIGLNSSYKKFHSIDEAYQYYVSQKEIYVKQLAKKYYLENKITKRVYKALMKWKVKNK